MPLNANPTCTGTSTSRQRLEVPAFTTLRSGRAAVVFALLFHSNASASLLESCASACAATNATVAFFGVPGGGYGLGMCLDGEPFGCASSPASVLFWNSEQPDSFTVISAPYSRVSASLGEATLSLPDGSKIVIVDSFSTATAAAAAFSSGNRSATFAAMSRNASVSGGGRMPGAGFASRFALPLDPAQQSDSYTWFLPGLYYNDGGEASGSAWIPAGAIGGGRAGGGTALAREDRLGAPLVMLQDSVSGRVVGALRPATTVPATVLEDTLTGAALVDSRLSFASLGIGSCIVGSDDESAAQGPCSALTVILPGCEFPVTYQSGSPSSGLLRFHPTTAGFSSALEIILVAAAAPQGIHTKNALDGANNASDARFLDMVDWAVRGAASYYDPLIRADIDVSEAAEAQVRWPDDERNQTPCVDSREEAAPSIHRSPRLQTASNRLPHSPACRRVLTSTQGLHTRPSWNLALWGLSCAWRSLCSIRRW